MKSIKQGFELAKKTGKPIVIDLYADWCSYCKVLENEIFPSTPVTKELEKFIPVRLNGEEFPNLMSRYEVKGYPTILFLDKNGNFIDKLTGLPSKEMVLSKLKIVYEKKDIEGILLANHKKDPDGVEINYKLGIYYYQSGDIQKSEKYFLTSVNSKKIEAPDKRYNSNYNLCLIQIEKEMYLDAVNCWTKYLETYPPPKGDERSARYYRGLSLSKLQRIKEAKEDLVKAKELAGNVEEKKQITKVLNSLK
ncbi:MAG: thioredoxin fold domain-containing protein [Leptospiraceae bacterium]|nr:thioredoxin fold domain-containing protein [Leptospiraceae bacterium]NUM41011.1 thioredoxin fold domain-containing protein [Leptospiraceae bacterium]